MRAWVEALLADRVVHLVDEEGRFLTEQADSDYVSGLETPCRYRDRRQGTLINRPALQQVGRHWQAIQHELRLQVPPNATLQQAFQMALQAVCAALLWPSPPLPAHLAAHYKACVGFCQVFAWLVLEDDPAGTRPLASLGDGDSFFHWLDAEGWLLGGQQACAGSRGQIRAIFQHFCSGRGAPPPLSPELELVALQTALVLGTYQAMRQGGPVDAGALGQRLLQQGRAPWLFAVTARPQGQPQWARRFLPTGTRSAPLERFLTGLARTRSDTDRERLFWEVIPAFST